MNIDDIVKLSDLLGELGNVKRATKLPNGELESDSHHSFMLAVTAYEICMQRCPELDMQRVVLFALAHDLLEIVTGDEDTLHYTHEELAAKHLREQDALHEFDKLFKTYPHLKKAMYDYEKLDTPEAATVFVLDKACTTWTHIHDNTAHARSRNIHTKADVMAWAEPQRAKMEKRLKAQPPKAIMDIYVESFQKLGSLYE